MNKKLLKIMPLVLMLALIFPHAISADMNISNSSPFGLYADKTTASADGKDSIKLTYKLFSGMGCKTNAPSWLEQFKYEPFNIKVKTPGANLNKNLVYPVKVDAHDPEPNQLCNWSDDGLAYKVDITFESVFLTSTVPGPVKVVYFNGLDPGDVPEFYYEYYQAEPLTFLSPNSGSTTTTPKKNTPISMPTPIETPRTLPAIPVIEKLQVGNVEHAIEKIKENKERIEFKKEEQKIFSGKTIPEGIVHLYFHSDPFEDTVTADTDGNWSYELTKNIGEGDHKLQIAVTDPKTNLTSEKSEALEFAVAGEKTTNAPGVIEEDDAPPLTLNPIFWVILSAVIVGVSVGGYFGYRKIKGKKAKIKEEKTEELEKPSQE